MHTDHSWRATELHFPMIHSAPLGSQRGKPKCTRASSNEDNTRNVRKVPTTRHHSKMSVHPLLDTVSQVSARHCGITHCTIITGVKQRTKMYGAQISSRARDSNRLKGDPRGNCGTDSQTTRGSVVLVRNPHTINEGKGSGPGYVWKQEAETNKPQWGAVPGGSVPGRGGGDFGWGKFQHPNIWCLWYSGGDHSPWDTCNTRAPIPPSKRKKSAADPGSTKWPGLRKKFRAENFGTNLENEPPPRNFPLPQHPVQSAAPFPTTDLAQQAGHTKNTAQDTGVLRPTSLRGTYPWGHMRTRVPLVLRAATPRCVNMTHQYQRIRAHADEQSTITEPETMPPGAHRCTPQGCTRIITES